MLFRFLIFICLLFSFTLGFGEDTEKVEVKQEEVENTVEEESSFKIFSNCEGNLKEVQVVDGNSGKKDSSSLDVIDEKAAGNLYDMEFPIKATFDFNKHELQTKGVYVLYTMRRIYFIIGGRVYGPVYDSKKEFWENKWVMPKDFQKIAKDEDYEIYYFGDVPYIQLKKFHIYWLSKYNTKKYKEATTNECYFTDILLKMTNYKIKFYSMSEGMRLYVKVPQIMKKTEKYFPPIKEVFEGEFL